MPTTTPPPSSHTPPLPLPSTTTTTTLSTSTSAAAAASASTPSDPQSLSPLEQQVLDEYAALLTNLNTLNQHLADLTEQPSARILDALRGLERKTSLVHTLLKASVYSIVLQQQIGEEDAANANASANANPSSVGVGDG